MEFEYVIENGEVTITGVKDKFIRSVEIPEFIEGYPVTGIAPYSFESCIYLTNIIIHSGVTRISYYAFQSSYGRIYNNVKIIKNHIINNKFIVGGCNFLTIVNQINNDYIVKSDNDHYYLIGKQLYTIRFGESMKMEIC